MSLLIHGMPTAVTVWITLRSASDWMRTRNSLVVNSFSSPPILAMVMFTSFPLRPSSSPTDNLIKLTCGPESRSRFPCFLTFPDPRISTSTTGRIACVVLVTDEIVKVLRSSLCQQSVVTGGESTCTDFLEMIHCIGVCGSSWKRYDLVQLVSDN